jgi:hypothetical protein
LIVSRLPVGIGPISGAYSYRMSRVDRYRQQAEEARQQAERAISPLDKEELMVAGEWIKLAQHAESWKAEMTPKRPTDR